MAKKAVATKNASTAVEFRINGKVWKTFPKGELISLRGIKEFESARVNDTEVLEISFGEKSYSTKELRRFIKGQIKSQMIKYLPEVQVSQPDGTTADKNKELRNKVIRIVEEGVNFKYSEITELKTMGREVFSKKLAESQNVGNRLVEVGFTQKLIG